MILNNKPDGGNDSGVTSWGLELKGLFSIVLLKFEPNNRENYHSHAFNALTWFIKGKLTEVTQGIYGGYIYRRSFTPKFTPRSCLHRVLASKDSWCFTIRGPWVDKWEEYNPNTRKWITLTHGRKVVHKD